MKNERPTLTTKVHFLGEVTLSHQERLERAISSTLLPEAKVILLGMLIASKTSATAQELCGLINAPLHEVLQGAHMLSSTGHSVSKGHDMVILSKDWQ